MRPSALLREVAGRIDERSRSVNVSDGGHIENLATIELLRRRCKYIVVGDGEMDPEHHFNGLSVLIRTARIEEGIEIEIALDGLRLVDEPGDETTSAPLRHSKQNWAIGKINYPDAEPGYLLYLKASLTGHEDETIRGYRAKSPAFPHESTADQFFDEGQFEAYRTLGYSICRGALWQGFLDRHLRSESNASFADVQRWFEALWGHRGIDPIQVDRLDD